MHIIYLTVINFPINWPFVLKNFYEIPCKPSLLLNHFSKYKNTNNKYFLSQSLLEQPMSEWSHPTAERQLLLLSLSSLLLGHLLPDLYQRLLQQPVPQRRRLSSNRLRQHIHLSVPNRLLRLHMLHIQSLLQQPVSEWSHPTAERQLLLLSLSSLLLGHVLPDLYQRLPQQPVPQRRHLRTQHQRQHIHLPLRLRLLRFKLPDLHQPMPEQPVLEQWSMRKHWLQHLHLLLPHLLLRPQLPDIRQHLSEQPLHERWSV